MQPRAATGAAVHASLPVIWWFLTGGVAASTTYKCADGSDGLSQAVYAGGNKNKEWSTVTCIPQHTFSNSVFHGNTYAGNVTLDGADFGALVSIDPYAFYNMGGTLKITGAFSALQRIEDFAFFHLSSATSELNFTSLPELTYVHERALGVTDANWFKGTVSFPASPFPNWKDASDAHCGSKLYWEGPQKREVVFWGPGRKPLTAGLYESGDKSEWSTVNCIHKRDFKYYTGDVTLEGTDFGALDFIPDSAFNGMKGRLQISGAFPTLQKIGIWAFGGKADSSINFTALPLLRHVDGQALQRFEGSISFPNGPFPYYEVCGTRLFGTDLVLLSPDQTPLTAQIYEDDANAACHDDQPDGAGCFRTVTCIPELAFYEYGGKNVTVKGDDFQLLAKVEKDAFKDLRTGIQFTGGFRSLVSIAACAFCGIAGGGGNCNNARFEITCSSPGVPLTIADDAFEDKRYQHGMGGKTCPNFVHVSDGEQVNCVATSATTANTTTQAPTVANVCKTPKCAQECEGDFCGAECEGDSCAEHCEGDFCGAKCKGDSCAERCDGAFCAAGCEGKDCADGCRGNNCNYETMLPTCNCEAHVGIVGPGRVGDVFVYDANACRPGSESGPKCVVGGQITSTPCSNCDRCSGDKCYTCSEG